MNNNPNQPLIDWLSKQEDEVCHLIFTRWDADVWRGVHENEDVLPLTDEQWDQTVRTFHKYFLGENEWRNFGECIPSVEQVEAENRGEA